MADSASAWSGELPTAAPRMLTFLRVARISHTGGGRVTERKDNPTEATEASRAQVRTPSLTRPLHTRRTNNHIYGQVVDDTKGAIVASASTIEKEHKVPYGGNKEQATAVGKRLAERAIAKGVETVFFDRNDRPYHGRIAALADAAREGGLKF